MPKLKEQALVRDLLFEDVVIERFLSEVSIVSAAIPSRLFASSDRPIKSAEYVARAFLFVRQWLDLKSLDYFV